MPITIKLTEGQAHDGRSAADMLDNLQPGQILLADRAYDSNALREAMTAQGAWATSGRWTIDWTRPPSAPSCIATGTWSSASSTSSSTTARSPPATRNTRPTTSPSSNSQPSASGCDILSRCPRPTSCKSACSLIRSPFRGSESHGRGVVGRQLAGVGARAVDAQGAGGEILGRRELKETSGAFLDGLLSGIERKTGWLMAEQAGAERPYRMQSLLGRSHWDAELLRDAVRALRGRGAGRSRRRSHRRRDRVSEERGTFGRRGAAIFRHRGADRKLPGRRVPLLREPLGSCADRSAALSAPRLGPKMARAGPRPAIPRATSRRVRDQAGDRA